MHTTTAIHRLGRRSGKHDEWRDLFPDGDPSNVQLRPNAVAMPEHRLALDMLTVALEDAQKPLGRFQREARAWLRDEGRMFSARLCCEALGVDYDALRARLETTWR